MAPNEIAAFDRLEHRAAALALRLIDDEAKVASPAVPGPDSYREAATRIGRRAD
ncbi:MAG TPA: hypothetical protein VFY92_07555 [Hyphomicrobiaceae bacterium]|nr:hypothetical protein [Hyphomicrobiaceae bacterium]